MLTAPTLPSVFHSARILRHRALARPVQDSPRRTRSHLSRPVLTNLEITSSPSQKATTPTRFCFKESKLRVQFKSPDKVGEKKSETRLYRPIDSRRVNRQSGSPLSTQALRSPLCNKSAFLPAIHSPPHPPKAKIACANTEGFQGHVRRKYLPLFEEMAGRAGITKASLSDYMAREGADPSQMSSLQSAFLVLSMQRLFLNTYPISAKQFLAVLTVFEFVWNRFPSQKQTQRENSHSFCPSDRDTMDKLGVQIGELRQVYSLMVGREVMRSGRMQEIFVDNGESGTGDFWSFLAAIPLIMGNSY